MVERLAFLLDGVPERKRIARSRDRLCAKIAHSQSLTQKPTSPDHRLPLTAFETHNGRSTFAAGTALHAPYLPFAIPVEISSGGWVVKRRLSQPEIYQSTTLDAARNRAFCGSRWWNRLGNCRRLNRRLEHFHTQMMNIGPRGVAHARKLLAAGRACLLGKTRGGQEG